MTWRPSAATCSTMAPPSWSMASGRAPPMLVGMSGMTVGSASGRQNTVVCAAVSCGSIAKAKPPTPNETLGRLGLRIGVGGSLTHYCVVIVLISSVTTKEFPGESGPIKTCQILIARDRPPVRCRWHCETPQTIRAAAVSSPSSTNFFEIRLGHARPPVDVPHEFTGIAAKIRRRFDLNR